MHVAVNMVGARRWCGVVLIMGHRHQWRHRLGVLWRRTPFTFILILIDCYTLPYFLNQ